MSIETISADELAVLFGRSTSAFKRRWRQMHDEHGFPAPLPGARWMWSRKAVAVWMDADALPSQGAPSVVHFNDNQQLPEQFSRNEKLVSAQRADLETRYGGEL